MHGSLRQLLVTVGDGVTAGDELAVIEAMKLEHRLTAEVDGTVLAVHVAEAFGFAKGLAAEDGGSVGSHVWKLVVFGYFHVMSVRYA
jgi:geranyl-CoA carboxylase alpha subunit